jgi:hypothetical protein
VQSLVGCDLRDRRKLQRNVSRELGVENQNFTVGLYHRARQVIAILQCDLISENSGR